MPNTITADGFTVNEHGTIQDPGKFEAEPEYTPYFYDLMLDGGTEEIIDGDLVVSVFTIDDDDRAKFPELLIDVDIVLLWITDQGFVTTREMSQSELERYEREVEEHSDEDPSDC